ncbi:MAG TPA: hypothetical protein VIH08_14875, partial [Blastococcus sp.]
PALVALMEWGDRYLAAEGDAPLELRHHDCGAPVHLTLTCEDGHALRGARDVRPVAPTEPRSTVGLVVNAGHNTRMPL